MYTQCPDCSTAFRVTAEVLKQAAGKVRCGGCGNAFNALEYLSESLPEPAAPKQSGEILPELKPEPIKGDGSLPASISAEQSAALLKTLDELAGSDIRIEDTGVEWRVMDDDEIGEAAGDESAAEEPPEDQPQIDELLDASPTPVDQFLTDTPPEVDSPEIFEDEPAKTSVDELRFDDNTPLPDDFDFADAPADEVDNEVVDAVAEEPADEPEDEPQAHFDLSEPDEWTDILDEFEDLAGSVDEPAVAEELEALADDDVFVDAGDDLDDEGVDEPAEDKEADAGEDQPPDMDTQFALQAEAMGIDLSGIEEAPEFPDESEDEEIDDIDTLLDQSRIDKRDIESILEEDSVDDDTVGDLDFDGFDEERADEDVDDEAEPAEDNDEPDLEESGQLELIDGNDEDELEDVDSEEPVILPMTEEEQTINMMIDQDLLAVAVKDDDGFASTIVIPGEETEAKAREDGHEDAFDEDMARALKDTGAGFETIIMEGEHVRSALDADKHDKDKEEAAKLLGAAAAAREAQKTAKSGKRNYGMIAGAAALVLLLVVQALHQSRDALATIPAFNSVAGPVYRALGKPLSPEWDITGWRFEVTRGNTDDTGENLTIYSRIGNKSEQPLPYPLIGISLTDRFEEVIGSRMLDPADYLSSDLDPRKLVAPGNTFNAVISIPSPSTDATGFKLNVCYRESGDNLRCAIDDFK